MRDELDTVDPADRAALDWLHALRAGELEEDDGPHECCAMVLVTPTFSRACERPTDRPYPVELASGATAVVWLCDEHGRAHAAALREDAPA